MTRAGETGQGGRGRWIRRGMAMLGIIVAVLHGVWMRSGIAESVMAGGSEMLMTVAMVPDAVSWTIAAGGSAFALLVLVLPNAATRAFCEVALMVLLAVGIMAGRVLVEGGPRGHFSVAVGWFMFPTREVDFSGDTVERHPGSPECSLSRLGIARIGLDCGRKRAVFWVGPLIQERSMEVLGACIQYFVPK